MTPKIQRFLLLALACMTAAGCGGGRHMSAEEEAATIAERKARNAAIMQTAAPVVVDGVPFRVGVAPDGSYALVQPANQGTRVNAFMLELAAKRITGCDAVFRPGTLAHVPGVTKMTSFGLSSAASVDLHCAGDARKPIRGLPDGAPAGVLQQAAFGGYPAAGQTYLSFSRQHGFQVNYFAENGRSWLWYPGNVQGVAEDWKTQGDEICFRHDARTYNPVTQRAGGAYQCEPLAVSRRTIVAKLAGDPFLLASGRVPYRLPKCHAPAPFSFDRGLYSCSEG